MIALVVICAIYLLSIFIAIIGLVNLGIGSKNPYGIVKSSVFAISLIVNIGSLIIAFLYSHFLKVGFITGISGFIISLYILSILIALTNSENDDYIFSENIKPKHLKYFFVREFSKNCCIFFLSKDFKYNENFQKKLNKGFNKDETIRDELISLKENFKNDELVLELIDNLLIYLED